MADWDYLEDVSSTLSIKLSDAEKARLQAKAKARNVSMSKLVKEGIEKVLEGDEGEVSCYDLMREHFEKPGMLMEGPSDLSTNKELQNEVIVKNLKEKVWRKD
ncbi:MAG: CopG family transcriptional regulator [Verrucomicrobiota bacterium]